jgi:hypothetical protein
MPDPLDVPLENRRENALLAIPRDELLARNNAIRANGGTVSAKALALEERFIFNEYIKPKAKITVKPIWKRSNQPKQPAKRRGRFQRN